MNIRDNFCTVTQIGVILLIATAYMHTICLTYKVIPTTPHPHIYRKAVLGELYFTRIDWYCTKPHIFFLKSRNLSTRAVSQKGHFHPAKTFMSWDNSNASFLTLPLSIFFSNSSVCWLTTRLNICQNHETSQIPPPLPQVLNHLKSLLFKLTTKRADGRCFFNHPMFPLATVKRFTSLPLLPKHQSSQPSLTDKSLLIFSYLACNSNITIFLDTSH